MSEENRGMIFSRGNGWKYRLGKFWMFALLILSLNLVGCVEKEDSVDEVLPTPEITKENQIETLTIYSVNPDTMALMPVSVKKNPNDEVAVYMICRLVRDNLNENDIQLLDAYLKGDTAYVSFGAEGKPLKNCEKKMETRILEAFSYSLLDNVKKCKKVVFQCDGDAYQSSQYSFGKDEVYSSE